MTDRQLIAVLAGLGHPLRLNLWRLLLPFGRHGLAAGTIATRMLVLPSSLSFHLRQMTQAAILVQRRSGRQIMYAVNHDVMDGLAARIAMPMVALDTPASGEEDFIDQTADNAVSGPSCAQVELACGR